MSKFFIYSGSQVRGPYTPDVLAKMLASGEINQETQICEGKGKPWRKMTDHPELLNASVPQVAIAASPVKVAVAAAAPLKAVPATAVPATAVPATAVPATAVPATAVPATVTPATVTPAAAAPAEAEITTVYFNCPYCKRRYSGSSEWLGRELACHQCGKTFVAGTQTPSQEAASYANEVEIADGNIICPHCWKTFDSEYILYIAAHPQLVGDPMLGASARKRFSPNSFNALGQAIDPMGVATTDMACPHCHLKIPVQIIEGHSLYISLVGAPSSGKSYYLASMLHSMKQVMADRFAYSFSDVDPEMNEVPDGYEETLFRPHHINEVAVLPKTQQTDFVDVVTLHSLPVYLQKPFIYELRSQQHDTACNVIFYDNAGEHFVPGADNLENPGTRHLACSNGIIFLFDPLNDALMRSKCDARDPQLASEERIYDQTKLMAEMIARIRKHRNLTSGDRCKIPLVIGVGKFDAWRSIFPKDLAQLNPIEEDAATMDTVWNRNTVLDVSFALRELLLQFVPELIHTAENFFEDVICMPFSSFGCFSSAVAGGQPGVIPANIRPIWVEEPLLALLANEGLLKMAPAPTGATTDVAARTNDKEMLFAHPVTGKKVHLPLNYAGSVLEIGGKKYRLPGSVCPKQNDSALDDLWG